MFYDAPAQMDMLAIYKVKNITITASKTNIFKHDNYLNFSPNQPQTEA